MMEQNSDRIYWILGAVLVGSLLIGFAVVLFKKEFHTNVSAMFDKLFGKADKAADKIPEPDDPAK